MTDSAMVLVVEDDITLQYLTRRQLEALGFSCCIAANGKEAVQMAKENDYALILMDIQMPIMDGLEATLRIRENEAESGHVPILGMTALPKAQECFEAGMDGFMLKPININHLEVEIKKWLVAA